MNWFKHDTDATQDAKVKKLLIRYGAVGYAIYFHCLELIAGDVSDSNLTFELEHDSEIIADNLHIHGTSDKSGMMIVEEIMRYIVELGLFTCSDNKIFCLKLLKRLDLSMTSNETFRAMISKAKQSHDGIMTDHDRVMLDKHNKDKKRKAKQITDNRSFETEFSQDFLTFYDSYPRHEGKKAASKTFTAKVKQGAAPDQIMASLAVYKAQIERNHTETQFIKLPATFLNCYEEYKPEPKPAQPPRLRFKKGLVCPYCDTKLPENGSICPKCMASQYAGFEDKEKYYEAVV